MKKLCFLVATSISYTLLSACSSVDSLKPFDQQQAAILLQQHGATHPSKQMVSLALPQKQMWKKTNYVPDQTSSFVMLVPQNESASHFSESIQGRTMPYEYTADVTAQKYVAAEIIQAKKTCRESNASIISETSEYVIYRLDTNGCRDKKTQWQIGKVFNGTDGVYSIRYVANRGEVSEARFKQMSQVIKTAALVRDTRANF